MTSWNLSALGDACAADASVTLCATQRLARNLRLADSRLRSAQGNPVWPTLTALTADAWLARLGEQVSLSGAVPSAAVPVRVLSGFQEMLVWRQIIEADAGLAAIELFDRNSLARTAADAHALTTHWQLPINPAGAAEELRRFAVWRQAFFAACNSKGWLDEARYRQRVCDWIEGGCGCLPSHIVFAGFDVLPPSLRRLQAALAARGVRVVGDQAPALPSASLPVVFSGRDAADECRAAAAWARAALTADPAARIGIVVTDLEARRALLTPLLDAALEPDRLQGASDAPATRYNLSLGLPLLRQAIASTAVALLRVLATPQGMAPDECGALLQLPYWSADVGEAALRAQLDVLLRERPGQQIALGTVVARLARSLALPENRLPHHLHALAEAQAASRAARLPGAWAEFFLAVLKAVDWPGDRTLSSSEFQARAAFIEVMAEFAGLDEFLGSVPVAVAVTELRRLCTEKIFQPKTPGQPSLQVLGMLEATGAEFDALWVMGMNDDLWPPPPKPNPLLPAELQRRHATPGASAEVQAAFAGKLHADLLGAAPQITFSYAEKDGERLLRPSPLLDGLPVTALVAAQEDLPQASLACEYVDDALAPPVAEGEQLSGGSSLLKAQALCPAWAFYRYRLGARTLQSPADGLDAAMRGTLMHATLEAFWQVTGDLAGLQALHGERLTAAVAGAAAAALAKLETQLDAALPPTLRRLEAERLTRLCREWLHVEWDAASGSGRAPFAVRACEEKHTVTLGRLTIRLVIDRIDVLVADGRRIVIDYKTGGRLGVQQWSAERIAEPQLPLYAAFVLAESDEVEPAVAAVAFARLRKGECAFEGLAVADGLLPGVKPLETAAGEDAASAWQEMLGDWQRKLLMLADEIQRGEAAVCFGHVRDLAYCEVRPLLRLAERRQQFERRQQYERMQEPRS